MPETKNPTTEPKVKRDPLEINADIEAAKVDLEKLRPQVEADAERVARQEDRIRAAQVRWRVERPGEPFDPRAYDPPLIPFRCDADLTTRFHKQHYVIKRLEDELKEANK